MTPRFARKTCPQCGNECLADEMACWACGELFVHRPSKRATAPTLVGSAAQAGSMFARFRSPFRRPRLNLYGPAVPRAWLLAAALALAAGLGLRLAAFWYEARAVPAGDGALAPLRVVTTPPPPVETTPAPALGDGASMPPAPAVPAPIPMPSYRFRTNRPARSQGNLDLRLRIAEIRRPQPASRSAPSSVLPSAPATERARSLRAAIPPAVGHSTPPESGEIAVTLRNATPAALDFEIGPGTLSGTVAPYSEIPVPLRSGVYTIVLSSAGRRETLYDVEIARGRSYLIAFDERHSRVRATP
jgi:hypothetical protein